MIRINNRGMQRGNDALRLAAEYTSELRRRGVRLEANQKARISDLKTVGDVVKCHLMLNRDADLIKHLRSKSGFLDLVELADDSHLNPGDIYSFIKDFVDDKPNLTLIDKGESLYALKTDKGAKIYVTLNLKEW